MKTKFFKTSIALVAALACLSASTSWAGNASQLDAIKKELRAAPTAEMPAKAAQLVAQAKSGAAAATADAVITAVTQLRPAAVVATVSAIAKANETLAPAVAAKAAALQPKEAAAIARAAAGSAKAQAGRIVLAVCKVVPTKYAVVATAVAMVVPDATREILAAVSEAVPGLKAFVERAASLDKNATVATIMGLTDSLVQKAAEQARTTPDKVINAPPLAFAPPTVGPPFTPLSGTPTELNHSSTVEVPPGGGRNYSGP